MMDNLRRNVDEFDTQYITSNSGHDGEAIKDRDQDQLVNELEREGHKMNGFRKGLNKLDTVTTVPQLQQKFNKFNIIDEAAITTNTTTTTTTTTSSKQTCVAAAKTSTTASSSSSSSLVNKSLTQQQQNTALAKFNRIIDNTVPVTNTYNYQQHVAETLAKSSQLQQQQQLQHPHYQQHEQQEMPILSDSLKRRLANSHHQHQYNYYSNNTDLIVNNSNKINFSLTSATATAASTSAAAVAAATLTKQTAAVASTSKAAAAVALAKLTAAASSSQQEQQEPETATIIRKKSLAEDEQLERNDVHYLLKQLNSFSDIEEIEIVDMKQKQRQLEQQQYNKDKHFVRANDQQQQQIYEAKSAQQHEERVAMLNFTEYQHVERVRQQYEEHVKQHVSSGELNIHKLDDMHSDYHVVEELQQQLVVDVGTESRQHYQTITTSTSSPTATSLVIYSPSSQSHKGIRRYASQDEQAAATSYHHTHTHPHPHHHHHQQPTPTPHHHHYHHHQPHYVHLPHEHYSEGSLLNSVAAQAVAADPMLLQQFVDDYIFQSCHYLETNNFVANYRTAMVESSSHEFRPSTTTTTTRTSNEEFYEEGEAGYVEDHSSAHSFELHETEPPTVICKAPAPLPSGSRRSITLTQQQQQYHHHQQQQQYTMETRLCSSGVQTDLTASSLAQSFSLSSSLSSSEKHKRKPLFKCCYTPLDRWREKRSQQSQIQKRTKSATTTTAVATGTSTAAKPIEQHQQQQQFQQITTKNTTVAIVGGVAGGSSGCTSTILNSAINTTTTTATATTSSALVVQPQTHNQQHHQHPHQQSLSKNNNKSNNNAPYAV